jgi:hypothetical protein
MARSWLPERRVTRLHTVQGARLVAGFGRSRVQSILYDSQRPPTSVGVIRQGGGGGSDRRPIGGTIGAGLVAPPCRKDCDSLRKIRQCVRPYPVELHPGLFALREDSSGDHQLQVS